MENNTDPNIRKDSASLLTVPFCPVRCLRFRSLRKNPPIVTEQKPPIAKRNGKFQEGGGMLCGGGEKVRTWKR